MKRLIVWLLIILPSCAYAQSGGDYCKGGKVVCLSQCFPSWKKEDGSIGQRPDYTGGVISKIKILESLDEHGSEEFWVGCRKVRICSGNDAANAIANGNALCLPPKGGK